MSIIRYYHIPGFTEAKRTEILSKLSKKSEKIIGLKTELCYHIEIASGLLAEGNNTLKWLLQDPFQPGNLRDESGLKSTDKALVVEVGPRFNFSTSNSTNAVSICRSLGLKTVKRLEVSRRYLLEFSDTIELTKDEEEQITSVLYDRMTECIYTDDNLPKTSFDEKLQKIENIKEIDVLGKGVDALIEIDKELGLAFDEADFKYYTDLFVNVLKRNPTNVECFDLAQSNSEHSRHWFFKGKMIIDHEEHNETLIDLIMATQKNTHPNNVIKFSDNSSAIKGYIHRSLKPVTAGSVSELRQTNAESHLIFTAETHNFPTGVAPFSGATTGTGGRIRDVQCVGRGGYYIAGTAGYSVGNLNIPDYALPWENPSYIYPHNFASPLEILVEASNGASDYGNKFGEPLISGFVRSFGLTVGAEERREFIKPIMFSGGIGTMEAEMVAKLPPKIGDRIIKIGGPVYRIGVGGGSASSVEVQGDNRHDLDFNAVQRGDAEMEQKLNRVIRACLEAGSENPILSIHDQGAGGNGNVLKELVEPAGGIIYASKFDLGDPTINTLELWGAEYQESNALLCAPSDLPVLESICGRERCPMNVVGEVTGDGRIVLALDENKKSVPVDLDLEHVLGKMPQKIYELQRIKPKLTPLSLPPTLTIYEALTRVLRLPSVASKRYLTNKVDRCVTGLIAQQQCVGPLHTPLADCAVVAISHFGYEGIASSIGEQPIKGLIDNKAGARLSVAEALSNLVFASITHLKDVKCSGNWMWPAKLPGEGAALFDACHAMCDMMKDLGIAVDGGKDSLSMAARVGSRSVKAPGTLVISTYAPCPDVRRVITPDLKLPAIGKSGRLLFVDLSHGYSRLGGTALAQCFGQLGDNTPDVQDVGELGRAFQATQQLIRDGAVRAGHDVSDGGLIVCLLEMCFAGMSGIKVTIKHRQGSTLPILFAEEVGWVLEVADKDLAHCLEVFHDHQVPVYKLGRSLGCGMNATISITVNNACYESTVLGMMRIWEETSYKLELQQTIKQCADDEYHSLADRKIPQYELTFNPDEDVANKSPVHIKVAVVREEGSNGDREMAAALVRVGFKVWDITMQDLLDGKVNLDEFRGLIFPGGFSYADVLGSAKGWAGGVLFHAELKRQFEKFLARPDTFSLGVCNGCQLMALIGWVDPADNTQQPSPTIRLEHNLSERFECRWTTVRIPKSNAVMLKGMEGSVLGVWVAHGEGRFTFRDPSIYQQLVEKNCVGLQYVDDDGQPTERYPLNPNGSVDGVAGVCSANGRHLAMMPHPERCVQFYQWPYVPPEWSAYQRSPWEKMFRNAYDWCTGVEFHTVYY